jgi:hypothetical protein
MNVYEMSTILIVLKDNQSAHDNHVAHNKCKCRSSNLKCKLLPDVVRRHLYLRCLGYAIFRKPGKVVHCLKRDEHLNSVGVTAEKNVDTHAHTYMRT